MGSPVGLLGTVENSFAGIGEYRLPDSLFGEVLITRYESGHRAFECLFGVDRQWLAAEMRAGKVTTERGIRTPPTGNRFRLL